MAVGGYDGMHLIYEALKKTGGKTDGDSLIAAMKGMKWESPRGPISIDPETRDIVQNIYIRKVEKENGELYNVEFATFEAVKDPGKAEEVAKVPLGDRMRARSRCQAFRVASAPGRASGPHATTMLTILFDGIAYGMLLFVLACGLAVTLGLMNFVNLAHGAFAMAGGYVTVVLVNRCGVPFFAALPLAFLSQRRARRRARAHALRPRLPQAAISTRCCSPSASSSCRWRPSTTSWARAQVFVQPAGMAAGPVRCVRRRRRPLPAADHRDLRRC